MDRRTAGGLLLAGAVVAVALATAAFVAAFVTSSLPLVYASVLLLLLATPLLVGAMVARGHRAVG